MSTENLNQEEQKAPSKEEVISFLQEQIEVKKVQLELQKLNAELAIARAEELKALSFIGQITNPSVAKGDTPYEGGTPHIITQEDMDNNPELAEEGIKVGDEVIIPAENPKGKRNLKK